MNLTDRKFYFVKHRIFFLITLCLFGFIGCSGEKKLTEQDVLDVMNKMDTAAENKDSDALIANLSEKVQINATVTIIGKTPQSSTYTRDQYQNLLKGVFSAATNYLHERKNIQVKISSDGKTAIVTSELAESVTMDGQIIKSIETSVASFVKENGKLVVRFIDINAKQV